MSSSDIVWRGMDRPTLDAAYNNGAAVADSAERLAGWTARSEALRARQPADCLDIAYGPRPRKRIDLYRAEVAAAPLLVFIHGGYWQRNSKEIFGCMAEGPLAAGFDVALVGYTLAPDARLAEIVAEAAAAVDFLGREGDRLGLARRRTIVSGWSAGAHLAATLLARTDVDAGLLISGVYDIEPCRLSYLNEKLALQAADVDPLSPIRHVEEVRGRAHVTVGEAELPELQRQSRDYAAALAAAGRRVAFEPIAGANHFTILEELARPGGRLVAALEALAKAA